MKNVKAILAIMLCGTACAVIVTFVISAAFYPPNTISETSRSEVWKLLFLIIGVVSGYLGKAEDASKPLEPPK